MNPETVLVSDLGFRYGLGVFETVMVRGGRAELLEWHGEGLREGALALGLPEPQVPGREEVPCGDGVWRWFHTGTGTRQWWQEGVEAAPASFALGRCVVPVHSAAWTARFKTLAYLGQVQNRPPGRDEEVVVTNEAGEVVSAAMGNLFWVRQGRLETAPHEAGCRKGTVRRWVMERGGMAVVEVRMGLERLAEAEEVLVTNSRVGIVPARCWPGREVAEVPGPVARSLRGRWREWMECSAARG
ncbi:MAG: aminotransferase class IV [Verrucomicrobiia bacterium]